MILKYKDDLLKIIHKHLPGCKVYLFGLHEKKFDNYEELEELIALDFGSPINPAIIGNILYDIKNIIIPLNVDFDIVDFYKVSDDLSKEIKQNGVLLKN